MFTEEEIERVKKEIARLEAELETERVNRRHREEYNNLCSLIFSLPSRAVSLAHIQALNEELETLSQQVSTTTSKFDFRSKQFQILLHAAHQLQFALEEEQKEEELKKQSALAPAPNPEPVVKSSEDKKEDVSDKLLEEGRIMEEDKVDDADKNEREGFIQRRVLFH
jgi:hypothetical protein